MTATLKEVVTDRSYYNKITTTIAEISMTNHLMLLLTLTQIP